MSTTMTGRCLCGAVSFEASGVETGFHSCHCSMCRRWSGGPAMAASVEKLAIDGDEHVARFASSDWAERIFCRQCGSNLFYFLKDPGQYVVWIGAFDDPAPFQMSGEIFVDEKPGAYNFAGDHPRLTGAEFMASIGA